MNKKAVVLFEVMLAALLVSLISVFLFRGYSILLSVAKKSSDYLKLMEFSEKKIWDLREAERSDLLFLNIPRTGNFDSGVYSWNLSLEESNYGNLKKTIIEIKSEDQKAAVFDTIFFLKFNQI